MSLHENNVFIIKIFFFIVNPNRKINVFIDTFKMNG